MAATAGGARSSETWIATLANTDSGSDSVTPDVRVAVTTADPPPRSPLTAGVRLVGAHTAAHHPVRRPSTEDATVVVLMPHLVLPPSAPPTPAVAPTAITAAATPADTPAPPPRAGTNAMPDNEVGRPPLLLEMTAPGAANKRRDDAGTPPPNLVIPPAGPVADDDDQPQRPQQSPVNAAAEAFEIARREAAAARARCASLRHTVLMTVVLVVLVGGLITYILAAALGPQRGGHGGVVPLCTAYSALQAAVRATPLPPWVSAAAADRAAAAAGGRAWRTLEPPDGVVLHGIADASVAAQVAYGAFARGAAPTLHRLPGLPDLSLTALNASRDSTSSWLAATDALCRQPTGAASVLLLDVPLTREDVDGVVSGDLDGVVAALVTTLTQVGQPAFVRLGAAYAAGGGNATTYVAAWRRVAAAVHADPVLRDRVAVMWAADCDTGGVWHLPAASPYWPGADVVDWVSVGVYDGDAAPGGACVNASLTRAASAVPPLPVMVTGAAPRGIGANGTAAWASWYQPFVALLASAPATLKAFAIDTVNTGADGAVISYNVAGASSTVAAPYAAALAAPPILPALNVTSLAPLLGLPRGAWEL